MPIRPIEIMEKHTYDPNKDGLIAVAQLETEMATEGEVDTKVSVHKSDASAHHAKTGHNEVYGLLTAGLAADRPAASIAGRFYFSTDTLILQRDNGTAWVEMARGETAIRLAQLSEKAHSSLTGIGASDHHIKTTSFADITDRAGATKLNWGVGKLLKGAGASTDPTEIIAPDQDLRTTDNVAFVQVTVGDIIFKNNWYFTEIENGIALINNKGNIVRRWTNE